MNKYEQVTFVELLTTIHQICNIYEQISTNINKYQQICISINKYEQISTIYE